MSRVVSILLLASLFALGGCTGFKDYAVRNAEELYGVPARHETVVPSSYAPAQATIAVPTPVLTADPNAEPSPETASAPADAEGPMCITADGSQVPC
ncbi:MAG: hypothetical protein KDI98_04000 [Hyphomicrobiaceae bacterium]|nr:hypothetical protein [Hyphomicrobiaceae bacterium]